jgi:hypothetical protein
VIHIARASAPCSDRGIPDVVESVVFSTAACNDIDPLGLVLRHVMLDGVHSLHGRVF